MNQRISTKRSVANMLLGGAALLGVWAVATSLQSQAPRDQQRAVAGSPTVVQEVLRCQRQERDDCFASVRRVIDASRLAPVRKALVSEQIEHRPGLA